MKFQSSDVTAAPIQGYSNTYYLENKYIPTSSVRDLADSWNNDSTIEEKDNEYSSNDNHNGRILRYDTITMTSPVLSSARLANRTSKRYITNSDVNELNEKLQALLLNTRNDDDEDDDDENDDNNVDLKTLGGQKQTKSNIPAVELSKRDQATTTYFGRCSLMVYNSVTNNFVQVVRSARLSLSGTNVQ